MLELFILWKLFDINDAIDVDDDDLAPLYFGALAMLVLWPIALFIRLKSRGDHWYMAASVAVGVACISFVIHLGLYLALGAIGVAYTLYLMHQALKNNS